MLFKTKLIRCQDEKRMTAMFILDDSQYQIHILIRIASIPRSRADISAAQISFLLSSIDLEK